MNALIIFSILFLFSCAKTQERPKELSTSVANTELLEGNVVVWAMRFKEEDRVCFEIKVKLKGMPQKFALSSNWNLAWMDQNDRYYLLSLNQRNPASTPQKLENDSPQEEYEVWTNEFKACALNVKLSDVKSIILTPKKLPSSIREKIVLDWKW